MNNFSIPDGWICMPFSEVVYRLQSKGGKLSTKQYQEFGSLPIVDQGQVLIAGFTDSLNFVFQGPYPVIVFGDHTRNVKYIDFKFAVGADGVVLLRSKDVDKLDIKFLYYYIKNASLHDLGYSRHFKILKNELVYFPKDIGEQRRIVARIEELTKRAEEAWQIVRKIEEELDLFTPSLLSKAFRGEL